MNHGGRILILFVLSGLGQVFGQVGGVPIGSVYRTSLTAQGAPLNGPVFSSMISDDGQTAVFMTLASNMGFPVSTALANPPTGVYARDIATGQVTPIIVDAAGQVLHVFAAQMSGDGRFVASLADRTCVFGETATLPPQLIVVDRQTGNRDLITKTPAGTVATTGFNTLHDISADGRYVLFTSSSTDLAGASSVTGDRLLRYDRQTGVYEPVALDISGQPVADQSFDASMSGSGRFVVFRSPHSGLCQNDTNNVSDVFIRDMTTTMIERVSVSTSGAEVPVQSFGRPSVSEDGRFVLFRNGSQAIASNANVVGSALVVRDRFLPKTEFVAVTNTGQTASVTTLVTRSFQIAPNGRTAAFVSTATFGSLGSNLAPMPRLWIKNLETGTIILAVSSTDPNLPTPNIEGAEPYYSRDGQRLAFISSTAIVAGDTNLNFDAFAFEFPCNFVTAPVGSGHPGSGGITPTLFGTQFGGCSTPATFSLVSTLGAAPTFLLIGTRDPSPDIFGSIEIYVDTSIPFLLVPIATNGLPGVPGGAFFSTTVSLFPLRGATFTMQGIVIDGGAVGGVATSQGLAVSVF